MLTFTFNIGEMSFRLRRPPRRLLRMMELEDATAANKDRSSSREADLGMIMTGAGI